jgi:hypothetical protein
VNPELHDECMNNVTDPDSGPFPTNEVVHKTHPQNEELNANLSMEEPRITLKSSARICPARICNTRIFTI